MEPQTVITRRIAQRSLQVARRGTEIEDAHTAPLPKKSCHQVLPDKPTSARNKRLHHHPWPHSESGALSLGCSDKTGARSHELKLKEEAEATKGETKPKDEHQKA